LGFFWSLPLPSNRLENPLQKEPLLREKTTGAHKPQAQL
jgi:hypothetical protein